MPTRTGNPKKIDHSTIPPAVRKAAEAADRARDEAYKDGNSPAPQPEPSAPPQSFEPSAPPQGAEPLAPEPPAPPQGAEPPAPEPPPPAGERLDPEKLQRDYDAQVGRNRKLQQDVAALTTRLDEMTRLLATVQSAPPEASAPFQAEELLTPEEKEEWGPVLPVIEKRFKELYGREKHELQEQIKDLKTQVGNQDKRAKVTTQVGMFERLDNHPVLGLQQPTSWRVVNEEDDFLGWLQYLDNMSGRKRGELLNEAVQSSDAGRVAAIFEGFLREAGRYPAPQAAPKSNGAGSPPPQPGLERYAAPGPARTAPAGNGAAAEPEWFTIGDISRFYADSAADRWKGREKEKDAYEKRLFAAQRAGRIRPGPPQP